MPPQRKVDLVLDSVKRLLRVGATANLSNLLQKQHPADLAQIFSQLPDRDRIAAFAVLVERNSRLAMETLSELGPETGAQLLAGRSAEEIAKLVQELPSDDAAALIDNLPEELSTAVLELMGRRESGEVENLLEYPEQTAGRIMNPHVFALAEDMTVGEAITALQSSRDVEMVFYLYIVDARGHLVGVTSLRRLLLVSPETPLKRIMTADPISARVDMDQEEVARLVASYNLLAIPVVDEPTNWPASSRSMTSSTSSRTRRPKTCIALPACRATSACSPRRAKSLRKRMPWLIVNLATAFLAAAVVGVFQNTIDGWAALAVFMPIAAGMGGNAATQTLTVIIRGLALGELTWSNSRKALVKNLIVGVANGVVTGTIAALVAWTMNGDIRLGIILGLALVTNLFVAGLVGTLIPLGLKALKVDPALASTVFITTFTDVCGFASFLGLATLFTRYFQRAG